MVVCNTSVMQLPTGYPITPIIAGLCNLSLNTISAIPFNQRVPTAPILQAPALAPTSLHGLPPIRCTPPSLSPRTNNSPLDSPRETVTTGNIISCNGVNLVPCTVSSLPNGTTSVVPLTQGFSSSALIPFTPKLTSHAASTNSISTIPCNPGIYTCNPMTNNGVVQCTPRVVNGHSVLQCTPGVCPIAPAMLPTTPVEVCPMPPSTIVPNTPAIYPVNSTNSLPSNLCASTAISSWKQSYGMEQVWQSEFKFYFSQYTPHTWMLFPVITKPEGIWNTNVDSAKVRFCCEECGHGWTSMKGRVAFWFMLNPVSGEGVVCLKLYGQQCDRCKSGNYEPAMWYPEEVTKVLVNIYNRVGQVYYGFQQAPYHRERRAGKPRTPHNSDLCQACKDGVCSERR